MTSAETRAIVDIFRRNCDYFVCGGISGAAYYEGTLPVGGRHIRVVATQTLDLGQRSAVVAFGNLHRLYRPAVVVLVGTAGAIDLTLNVGDVVVADEVIYYEARHDSALAPTRRGQVLVVPAAIRHALNRFFSANGEPAMLNRQPADDMAAFKIFRGAIGSGEALITNRLSEIRSYLLQFYRTTLAVEMEAAGVAQACHEELATDPQLRGWLTIRGISDHAETTICERHRQAAARNAAVTFEFLLPFLAPAPGVIMVRQ